MSLSKLHTNRQWHNWLVYQNADSFLEQYSDLYRGVLYDLGCGESPYRNFFLQHADKYIGVDWSGSFHEITADIVADLNKVLPIESEVADTIISLSVMEHLSEPQVMLNEAYRILKPEGHIILQVPWQWHIHEAPYDFFRFTPYGLKNLFDKAGFQDIVVKPQSGFFSTWILKANYFSTRFIRGPKFIAWFVKMALLPIWTIGQWLAPFLDKLDKNWEAESTGYFVTAKKPDNQ